MERRDFLKAAAGGAVWLGLSGAVGAETPAPSAAKEFRPGEVWLDTEGKPIQAHGGGILFHAGVFYWYGEDKTLGYDE